MIHGTGLFVGRIGGAGEQVGFEQRNAIEAPGGVDQFLDELSFGRCGGLVFGEELAAVGFVGGRVFGGQDDGLGGEAVADGVERGALFAGFGARASGVLRVARFTAARLRRRCYRGWAGGSGAVSGGAIRFSYMARSAARSRTGLAGADICLASVWT